MRKALRNILVGFASVILAACLTFGVIVFSVAFILALGIDVIAIIILAIFGISLYYIFKELK